MAEEAGSGADIPEAEKPLPSLREDITLLQGGRGLRGEPTWTLSDPVRGRFFQVGEHDVRLLRHWSLGTPGRIVEALHAEGHADVIVDDVSAFLDFLVKAELVDAMSPVLRHRLVSMHKAREQTLFQQLLHKYLFFRVPLVRPDRFLEFIYPRVRFLFQPWFPRLTLMIGLLGIILMVQSWERLASAYGWFLTPAGMLVFGLTLVMVKMLHEMGHALMCKHFGLRVPTMGVAFLVMWPVMYTDASEGWRLVSRRKRALIAAAGVITEIFLASYAMVAWFFLPDGILRSVALAVATTTWILSVAVNLNPLMRFDGYHFLSDILNVPNLQDRSFALARWRLRRLIFGLEEQPPERFPARLENGLVVYAWSVWVYRFFLFLGIAVLVYYLFFKALGVFLFAVEIWWFVVRPIWNEVRHWRQVAPHASLPRRWVFVGIFSVLFCLMAFPWKTSIRLPATLSAERYARVFLPADAQVMAVHVKDGARVEKGQLLIELASPELAVRVSLANVDVRRIEAALDSAAMDPGLYQDRLVLQQEHIRALATLHALLEAQEQLRVRAPYSGVVRDLDGDLQAGRWLAVDSHLLTVVAPGSAEVMAWLPEGDRERLLPDAKAVFWADGSRGPQGVDLHVREIDSGAVRSLDPPYHASVYGGSVAVTEAPDGSLIPQSALYRIRLRADKPMDESALLQRWRGHVVVEGERRSLLLSGLRWVVGVLIRESGL